MIDDLPRQLEALRPALLRFAMLQLRNEAQAEDVVQDTLIAMLEKPERFAGQSSLRTYVTAILKHKIIDVMRASKRTRQIEVHDDQSEADAIDALFAADGHTLSKPRDWGDPDATLEQKDFFRVMELCLEKLPPKTARVFMMREWLDFDTEEILQGSRPEYVQCVGDPISRQGSPAGMPGLELVWQPARHAVLEGESICPDFAPNADSKREKWNVIRKASSRPAVKCTGWSRKEWTEI